MKAQELFRKYAKRYVTHGELLSIDEEHFVQAITEIISQPLEVEVIKKNAEEIKDIVKEAFSDMTVIYAPECAGGKSIKELRDKIKEIGKGTLGYITTKEQEAIKKIDSIFSL